MGNHDVNRRNFMIMTAAVGGGMMIGIAPTNNALAAVARTTPWNQATGAEFTALISIAPDNTVTVRQLCPDIGNGAFSAAAQIVTEELKCDWSLVRAEFLEPNRDLREGGKYTQAGTLAYFSGRSTSQAAMQQMQQAGASARERLRSAAAQKWNVPVEQVEARDSWLIHAASNRRATFGEMAAAAAAIQLPKEPALTPPTQWTFLGKEAPRKLNLPIILDGSAKYGIDVRLPNMLFAALKQSPVHGGMLKKIDANAVRNMPGVRAVVVVDPTEVRPGLPDGMRSPFGISATRNGPQSAVAVVADTYWQAKTALDLLPVEWDAGPGAKWKDTQTVYGSLNDMLKNPANANIVRDKGNVVAELGGNKIQQTYLTPYLDHVNMEPLNGTALVTDDKVEMWMPTQHPQQVLYLAADETGVHPNNVHIHPTWVGTGFGRRVFGDDARMVVAVANKVKGRPVQVIWTREESIRQGRYRAIQGGTLQAALGPDGMPKAMFVSLAGGEASTSGLATSPYQTAIPNWRVQVQRFDTNLMLGPWRGPGYNSNATILETFINELAEGAKIDPVEYRRKLLANWPDVGWRKSLDEVAQKAGWGQQMPRGTAQGIAISNWGMAAGDGKAAGNPNTGTTVAAVVTAEVTRRGRLAIPRVDVAFDTGGFINRDNIVLAIESGVVMSLSATLHEEINLANGAVVEGNYDNYRLMRQSDPALPQEIHVHFGGLSGHERMSEIGEPPMGPPPPALLHAIYRATGKWIRQLPLDRHDLSWG